MSTSLDKCSQKINELYELYKENPYMLQRLENHITCYLPNTLENECKNNDERILRNNYLNHEKEMFIQIFLSKNQYYYLPSNNSFYEYNGKNYIIVKEDDIIHQLLSSISKDRVLMQWKHKTKFNILKQIKERNIFQSIPETDTIQNVLNIIYPSLFETKNQAKYFLTILGDNIHKKNNSLIFFVSPKMKKLLNEFDDLTNMSIGYSNILHNVMTKYNENHSYENCRLLKINEYFSPSFLKDILKNYGLDLLCVAAHYSNRYENSDNFINTRSDEELKSYTYYLKNNTPNKIVQTFCDQYIQKLKPSITSETDVGCINNIGWKKIHFLWKHFLSQHSLPSIIYSKTLKGLLREIYDYQEKNDSFQNITSKYLPMISEFIQFWEKNIVEHYCKSYQQEGLEKFGEINNNDENCISESIELEDSLTKIPVELEIDEVITLFKFWAKQNQCNGNISDKIILEILTHFFSHVIILEDKYILNVSCILWNKNKDIDDALESMKSVYSQHSVSENGTHSLITLEQAYNFYYKFCNQQSNKFIVSKKYFEKYVSIKLTDYIIYEHFIIQEWFQCV